MRTTPVTQDGTATAKTNNYLYYVAMSYNLEFHNGQEIVRTENVKYTANLGSYAFEPKAPSKYEPGSVEFAGWYQNPECTGDEVKLDKTTMPSSKMILYAKWVPVKHDVTVYRYRDAAGELHDLLCNHCQIAVQMQIFHKIHSLRYAHPAQIHNPNAANRDSPGNVR